MKKNLINKNIYIYYFDIGFDTIFLTLCKVKKIYYFILLFIK